MKFKIDSNIFRAYDIRGIYPAEINEKTAYGIGQAFVAFLKKKKPKVILGRDNRLSSPTLFKSLSKGIIEQGGTVIDIGFSTSPMLYWAVVFYKADGGINVTASHNPFRYNGFKLVKEKAVPLSGKSGIKEIKNLITEAKFKKNKKGRILEKNVLKGYIAFNLKEFDFKKIKPLKIAVDTANGVAGILVRDIFKRTKCKVFHIFSKLDGRFPNHSPDPLTKKNLKSLISTVKEKKADLGVAFDGDGDRVIFVDEKGKFIPGDMITALISQLILREEPGKKIIYDVRSSNIIPETIKKNGGIPIICRIGHSFIKEKMRKDNVFFAGEVSGHYYYQNHYFCEAPLVVLFKTLKEMTLKKEKLSELIKPFKVYFHSGEINFKIKNKEEILKKLEKKFKSGTISKIDGLRIDFKDWWFNVRPSNTEPLLRLVLEAKTKEILEKKKNELVYLISSSN